MGNYIDNTSIATYMPQLPALGESGYSATMDVIDQAIEGAEAIVDGYLGTKYSVPFSPVPPMVRDLARDISVHKAYNFLYHGDNVASNVYAERYQDWEKNAYAMLEMLQENKLVLTDTSGNIVSTKTATRNVRGTHNDFVPTFDAGDETGWRVDPDLVDEIDESKT